ncbi:MAG: Chromosomal replication initiator protein DnaA [Chlamydiae bacterium]|nr:Chromosomal replication initiator protein DnaA [Chlamydiota bacterium]
MRSWNEFLIKKEATLGKETVDKWLKGFKVLNYDAANLYLEASDTFQAQWFDEYIRPSIKDDFRNENNRPIKVHIQVANKSSQRPEVKHPELSDQYRPFQDPLDPLNTLENFVQTDQNKILLSLLSDFATFSKDSTPHYNPIYIYGPRGVGKTHLLQSVAHLMKARELNVLYVRLKTFMQNMVKGIKASKMSEFRKLYRDVDALIIDDIEDLSHKNATQEELFHTFNALHIEGKQIILSSNCNPQQLKAIEPRLMSRFEWGIVLPLNPPKEIDLKKILNAKLQHFNFPLDPHAKDFLVKRFSKNPQVLQRALSALILRAHLKLPQGKKLRSSYINIESIELLLSDLLQEQADEKVTTDRIIEKVAHYFGIKRQDILGKSQSRECALPRQISMYFCREILKMPFMQIGRFFSRDHSTVMSSVKQIQKAIHSAEGDTSKVVLALQEAIMPYQKSSPFFKVREPVK